MEELANLATFFACGTASRAIMTTVMRVRMRMVVPTMGCVLAIAVALFLAVALLSIALLLAFELALLPVTLLLQFALLAIAFLLATSFLAADLARLFRLTTGLLAIRGATLLDLAASLGAAGLARLLRLAAALLAARLATLLTARFLAACFTLRLTLQFTLRLAA
mgnify:CR=1 FL=1